LRHVRRGGVAYFRVADAEWEDPLDSAYAQASGGRWNPAGSFGVLYLTGSRDVARANVARRREGQPYCPEDLAAGPVLVELRPPRAMYVDARSSRGLESLGLPASYPVFGNGRRVSWSKCQPIGRKAWEEGEPGIACRSAALRAGAPGEELALFDRGRHPSAGAVHAFEEWFWGGESAV